MPATDVTLTTTAAEAPPQVIRPRRRADVWPLQDAHGLYHLDLTGPRRRAGAAVTDLADQLASLADAAWALERVDLVDADMSGDLNLAAAAVTRRLARTVDGLLGLSLQARADAVARGDWAASVHEMVDCDDDRVAVVYGPLKTWSSKEQDGRFGAIVSVANDEHLGSLAGGDAVLDDAVAAVGHGCGAGELGFWEVPRFVTSDVIACGGEPNTFPKHFALFLPEDAGVEDRGTTKTVVYTNVYEAQFRHISRPLGRAVMEPWHRVPDDAVLPTLLTWFRGHDISHFLGPHGRRVDHLTGLSGPVRGGLQEAFADVIGYLVASHPLTVEAAGVDADDLSVLYVSEMLRYFRRGWAWFPDSFAARLEIDFLVEGGWISAGRVLGETKVKWDRSTLREGLKAFGTELCAGLVKGDAGALGRLVHRCQNEPPWLANFDRRLRQASRAIGDSLVFGHSR